MTDRDPCGDTPPAFTVWAVPVCPPATASCHFRLGKMGGGEAGASKVDGRGESANSHPFEESSGNFLRLCFLPKAPICSFFGLSQIDDKRV